MPAPVRVVELGIIGPQVHPSRFGSGQDGLGHHQADRQHVLQLPALNAYGLVREDVADVTIELLKCLLELLRRPLDSHMSPHQRSYQIPNIRNINFLRCKGMKVVRVDIDAETFPKWCTANGHGTLVQADLTWKLGWSPPSPRSLSDKMTLSTQGSPFDRLT
jgi:hypothetical protein